METSEKRETRKTSEEIRTFGSTLAHIPIYGQIKFILME